MPLSKKFQEVGQKRKMVIKIELNDPSLTFQTAQFFPLKIVLKNIYLDVTTKIMC